MSYHLLYPMTTFFIVSSSKGKDNVMTANWVMPVSFDPFLVAIAVGKTRYTYKLIKESGEFVIAVPGKGMIEKLKICGSVSGKNFDKFEKAKLSKEKAKKVSVPLIKGCNNLECKVVSELEAGDHVIFVGEVLEIHEKEDKSDERILYIGNGIFKEVSLAGR